MNPQPKKVTERSESRKAFARSLGCIVAGTIDACVGRIEAHHVIFEGQGIRGSKVSDFETVGLCQHHHELARRRTWFENRYAIILRYEIERINELFAKQPKRARKERKRGPIVKTSVRHCPCGIKEHRFPVEEKVDYFCPKLGWVKVERRTA